MMTDFIEKLKNAAAEFLFTVRCPYCGKVIKRSEYACCECKHKFPETSVKEYAVGGHICAAPFPYEGIFKNALYAFKFKCRGGYSKQLAFMIVQSVNEVYNGEHFDIITCVPIHKKALKQRGYNQSELLARDCANIMGIPFVQTLEKIKENKIQHNLKSNERAQNVKGVYRIIDKKAVDGKKVLIIDDVITTGNTLGECARILMKYNCKKVSCATLCAVIIK